MMGCRKRTRTRGCSQRCRFLLGSVIVCMSSQESRVGAYTHPHAPLHANNRRSKSIETRLHSTTTSTHSAPTVNGLAAQEHSHSTSLFNVGYDAKSIINFYDQRPWEVGLRLNMLGLPLLGKNCNSSSTSSYPVSTNLSLLSVS